MERKKIITVNYATLSLAAAIVGLCSALLAYSLKIITEHLEHLIYNLAITTNSLLFIFLPTIGITAIYFLRKYAFKNRKNKGITEIYKTLDQRKDHLPLFKIPSHYINGFLTVIFGGSTGIEVSTVVASATIGNFAYEKEFSAKVFKRELICAGVVAGVAVLFSSPLAGWLFAMEVIARKINIKLIVACTASAIIAWVFIFFFDGEPLLANRVTIWNYNALPFFIVLSLLGGILSVYFTLLVTRMKGLFAKIHNNFFRVNLGAITVGLFIFLLPALFGDSYHGLKGAIEANASSISGSLMLLLAIAILKPLAAALTLGAGGDGGVFAPSIVAGAFLGLFVALLSNQYFGTHLIPINFVLVGAAATLSASLYAPFTSLILICNLSPNGYALFVPILIGCFVSYFFSKKLLPYNVYSHYFFVPSVRS